MNEKYKTTTPLWLLSCSTGICEAGGALSVSRSVEVSGGWGETEGNKQYAISNLQIKCGFAEGK